MNGSLTRRYTRALFESAVQSNQVDAVLAEIQELDAVLSQHAEFRQTLENAAFALSQRQQVLDAVAKKMNLSVLTSKFTHLLLDRGRVFLLGSVARLLQQLADKKAGRLRVKVVSAYPLDGAVEQTLAQALQKRTGLQIVIEKSQQADLLGGIQLQVGDTLYDGSVRAQLQQLRQGWLQQPAQSIKR